MRNCIRPVTAIVFNGAGSTTQHPFRVPKRWLQHAPLRQKEFVPQSKADVQRGSPGKSAIGRIPYPPLGISGILDNMQLAFEIPNSEKEREMDTAESSRKEPSQTLADIVYRRLRNDIIRGELEPGSRLRSDAIREAYSTGISPLREALTRLTAEKLVQSVGQRGFSVAPVSAADVMDTMEARVLIESEALRLSILNGGVEWETKIVAAGHALKRTAFPTEGPSPGNSIWADAHQKFHNALLSGCGSPWLVQLSDILFAQSERHRLFAVRFGRPPAARDRVGEHDAVLAAALDHDIPLAMAELARHFRKSAQFVAATISLGEEARLAVETREVA